VQSPSEPDVRCQTLAMVELLARLDMIVDMMQEERRKGEDTDFCDSCGIERPKSELVKRKDDDGYWCKEHAE